MINRKLVGMFSLLLATTLVAVMGITSCSSSGGDSSSNPTPAPASAVSIGSMTKGSVIVNGVTFDDTTATVIADDDAQKVLANGMVVKVKGTVNDDGLTGKAEKVEVVNEVSGTITSKNTDTFSVLNQTVLVDGGTVFAGGATNLAGLNADDSVEVHGQRDASRTIRATRVEKHAGGVVDEVRGVVSGKTATTFNIGSLPITFGISTAITPTGATFADGDIVQVHLNGTIATSIKVEDDDVEFEPGEGQEFEVEGFISGFTAHPGSFEVIGQSVQTSSSTRIEGGVAADLADDVKVEAEGHLINGILVANKIAFKETVRIQSNATTTGSADMLGKTVKVTSKTELNNLSGGISGIQAGDGLRVRGFVNIDGSITATRVESQNAVQADRHILQGPVTSKDAASKSLVILGVTISASGASSMDDSPDDSNPAFANIDAFFSAVTAGKTIVKARGAISGSTMTANEIEIE